MDERLPVSRQFDSRLYSRPLRRSSLCCIDAQEVKVLDQVSIDRLRQMDTKGFPVLSVYVNLHPGPESLRSVPARLKDLLAHVDEDTA